MANSSEEYLRGKQAPFDLNNESVIEENFQWSLNGFDIKFQQQVHVGGNRLDFVLRDKINVECDGSAYHNKKKDLARDKRLSELGYKIIRVNGSVLRGQNHELIAFILLICFPDMRTREMLSKVKPEMRYWQFIKIPNTDFTDYNKIFIHRSEWFARILGMATA